MKSCLHLLRIPQPSACIAPVPVAATHTESLWFAIRQPGGAVLMALALACVLTDAAVLALLLGGDYFQLFHTSTGAIITSGWQIWDLPKLFIWLGLVAWVLTLVLLALRLGFRRRPALRRVGRWMWVLGLLALLCAPRWMDPRIDYHLGPGRSLRLSLGGPFLPLINYSQESEVQSPAVFALGAPSGFVCTSSRRFKFLGLEVVTGFYPTLDQTNGLRLMQEHCRAQPTSKPENDSVNFWATPHS